MKTTYKKSFLGSIIALLFGTSCCWLSSLAIWLGGSTLLTFVSMFTQQFKAIILTIALLFFLIGLYQFYKFKLTKDH